MKDLKETANADTRDWKRFLVRWLTVSLFLHGIAAFLSAGFFHADEHFQILEFLNFKRGGTPLSALPPEYHHQMRPWLQPFLYFHLTHLMEAVGIRAPMDWALGYRLISSLVGWSATLILALCASSWFAEARFRKLAVVMLSLIWFLPALHARPSSENLSGAVFLLGFCGILLALQRRRTLPPLTALVGGLALGFAFQFRYQVGVMVAGALLWLFFVGKARLRSLFLVLGGITLAQAAAIAIDFWGYGQWTFAPWNYVRVNLFEGMASSFGVSPWWDFLRSSFTESWPLLGFLLLLSLIACSLLHPWHPLVWSHLPLLLVHSGIGHKELRFLFPLAHAGAFFAVLVVSHPLFARLLRFRLTRTLGWFLAGWNAVGLAALCSTPAWRPILFFEQLRKIHEQVPAGQTLTLYHRGLNPLESQVFPLYFYRPKGVASASLETEDGFREALGRASDGRIWFFQTGHEPPWPGCERHYQTLPDWIPGVLEAIGRPQQKRFLTNWRIFRCAREISHPR